MSNVFEDIPLDGRKILEGHLEDLNKLEDEINQQEENLNQHVKEQMLIISVRKQDIERLKKIVKSRLGIVDEVEAEVKSGELEDEEKTTEEVKSGDLENEARNEPLE